MAKKIFYSQCVLIQVGACARLVTFLPNKHKGQDVLRGSIISLKAYPRVRWRLKSVGSKRYTPEQMKGMERAQKNFSDVLS